MTCPDCKSEKIIVTPVSDRKKRGFGFAVFMIFVTVFTFGAALVVYYLMGEDTEVKPYAVCQDCGFLVGLNDD
jgi:DNA-directed RNA polymerase subunit RPC12/RpoP